MILYSAGHFLVTKLQRLMALEAVVGQVVRKEYIEFSFGIIVAHLMQELHRLGSVAIS